MGMNRTTLTNVGLQHLSGLTALEYLDFQGSRVDDHGVAALKDMRELRMLYLGGVKGTKKNTISDASLKELLTMTKLEHLGLSNTQITEGGAKSLIALPVLKQLMLESPALNEQAREKLTRQKPPDLQLFLSSGEAHYHVS